MEDDLDEIADGEREPRRLADALLLRHADGKEGGLAQQGGLKELVSEHLGDIDAREVNSIPIGRTDDGTEVVVRVGQYGPYVDGRRAKASLPEDLPPTS